MLPTASIPRFLLPQRGLMWRARIPSPSSTITVRNASHKAPRKSSKPIVLEQPTKFNPPSHGARLRKDPPRYPGPQLSAEEAAAQRKRQYPNMMPPPGSFMHWFIHNKSIHLYITMTTLFTLASTVWITNFKRDSPYAHLLPEWSQFFIHPIATTHSFFEVVKLTSDANTAETMERRSRKVDDVQKRAKYRKAHGLDKDEGFGGWTSKVDVDALAPAIPVEGEAGLNDNDITEPERKERRKVKKWFGIW